MPIEAVTFDFWNTIAAEPARGSMQTARREAVVAACERQGLRLEAADVDAAVATVIRVRERSWMDGVHMSPTEGARRLAEALALTGEDADAIVDAFLHARGAPPTLAPEIGPTLERLRDSGLKLGIVCDAGFTGGALLREVLDAEGLLEHFSGWAFSDEVGAYKPAPEIFEAALGMLGVGPSSAVHIGDLRRTDIAGGQGVGMGTVRYRGLADDPEPGPEADCVIDAHRELPAVLAGPLTNAR